MSLFSIFPLDLQRLICNYLTVDECMAVPSLIMKDDLMWKLKTKTMTDVQIDSKFVCKIMENLQKRNVKAVYLQCGFYENYIKEDEWSKHDIPSLLNDDIFLKNYVDCKDLNGSTLLIYLCLADKSSIHDIKKLIDNGANVNHQTKGDKNTSLICACWRGKEKVVRLLLDSGADVNYQTKTGKSTALMLACEKNYVKIVQILLEAGADVTLKDIDNNTALTRSGDFKIPVVKMLLEAGADINHENKYGSTLLGSYLRYMPSTDDKIRFLLEAGASTKIKNINGYDAKRMANILKTCKHIKKT